MRGVQRARRVVHVGHGVVTFLERKSNKRSRRKATVAIQRGNFDVLSRVEPRGTFEWEIY